MATGDRDDQFRRLKAVIPPWFGDIAPIVDAVLRGVAAAMAFIHDLLVYAKLQTRIRTASGGWLDLIAADFFGRRVIRGASADEPFRTRIIVNLFRERATRRSITDVLTELTGRAPIIFEPARVQDCGEYGGPYIGYGVAGRWGSLLLPYQGFVDAFRPIATGIPLVAGWGVSTAGYSRASRAEWATIGDVLDSIADEEIYAAVDGVKVAGTIVWTRIHN